MFTVGFFFDFFLNQGLTGQIVSPKDMVKWYGSVDITKMYIIP